MSQLFASGEYLELISFRMDRLELLAIQGTLKSLLQPHSSRNQFFWRSASGLGDVLSEGRDMFLKLMPGDLVI